MAVFRSRGTMPVVRDVLMMFVMVGTEEDVMAFIKMRAGNGIEFTGLGECTVDYIKGKNIRLKSYQGISCARGIRASSWVWRRKIVSDGTDFLGEVIRNDIREVVKR